VSQDAVAGSAFTRRLGDLARRLGTAAVQPTRGKLALAALFLLALTLRLVWIAYVDPSPRDGRFDDTTWYDGSAQTIADGQGYIYFDRKPTAAWPVGYPAFLAAIYRVTDDSVLSAKIANAFLGALTVLGVYALGARVFGRRAGWTAALVLAFFPNQVFFATLIMSEILSAFLLLMVLLAVLYLTLDRDRARWWGAAVVGLLIGLTAMVRGEFLLFFLVPLLPWRLVLGSWRRALGYTGVALVALALVLTPWTVRNAVRLHYPVIVGTGAVANLLAGHWSGADGAGTFTPGNAIQEQYKDLPNPEREVAIYRAHIRKAVAWAVRNPWGEITLVPRKIYHLYRADDPAMLWIQNRPLLGEEEVDWWKTASNGYYYVVGGWVLLSLPAWWCLRDPRRLLLILTLFYFSFIFGVVFIGSIRYHFALVPAAVVLASPALVVVWEHVRGRKERPVEEAGRPPAGPDASLTEGMP
jgi:4-amino-4-deoxy-L-arabinose transferase-like glycosyltransferase